VFVVCRKPPHHGLYVLCRCNDPEGHGCIVPQTPVGALSQDMSALNREIAERVSWHHLSWRSVFEKTRVVSYHAAIWQLGALGQEWREMIAVACLD